jgi:hypothetical protein
MDYSFTRSSRKDKKCLRQNLLDYLINIFETARSIPRLISLTVTYYLDKADIIYGVGDTATPITANPAEQVNLLLHTGGALAPDWLFIAGIFRQ